MADAVAIALRDNPRMAAAEAGVKAAAEGVKAARGAFGPSFGMSYSVTTAEEPISTVAGRRQTLFQTGLTQELFSGFRDLAAWQQSVLEQNHEMEKRRAAELDLALQVQEHYLAYLKAVENVRSAHDALERLRSQLHVTRAFFEEGLNPHLDVLQAEVDETRAEALLIQAENSRTTQVARLNTLLRLPVTEEVDYTGSLDPMPFASGFAACMELALRQRPDLRMAALSVDIAGKERDKIRSDYYPEVSANLNWNTRGSGWNAAGSSGLNTGYSSGEMSLRVDWNFFDWGRTWYADRRAGFLQSRLRAEAENLRQEVAYEVKSRLLMAADAERLIPVAQKAVAQAREAYDASVARYQTHIGTNTDVLDAQAKLSQEEASLTGARADYLSALARLYAAIGEIHPDLDSKEKI
jgi:outer membrane protein